MKTIAFYLITIILLLSWCSGCSHSVPAQSEIVAKTVSTPEMNTNDLELKMNPLDNTVWKEYRSILSGNFTQIKEDDYKKEMDYLYKEDSQNGKCEWKYIMMDFNKDGIDELFIQLTPENDLALFSYVNGKIKCIGIDDTEMNYFTQPLKDGKLLETYDYNGICSRTIFEYDPDFQPVNQKEYSMVTVDDYDYWKKSHDYIIDEYPTITKKGVYYFQNINGKEIILSKEDWKRIDEQIIPSSEWKSCSELNTN